MTGRVYCRWSPILIVALFLTATATVADPMIERVTPPAGHVSGGEEVIIEGAGFVGFGTTTVTFDGIPATEVHVITAGYGQCALSCVTPAHALGVVDVVVTNPDTTSATLEDGFTYSDLEATSQPVGTEVYENTAHSFSASVSGSYPPFTYTWQRDVGFGWEATQTNITSETSTTFTIDPLSPGDTGLYRLRAKDAPQYPIYSDEVQVTIHPHLVITNHPDHVNAYAFEPVMFEVETTGGWGALRHVWKKDGEDIPGAPDAPCYAISMVQPGDAGGYRCVVSDEKTDVKPSSVAYLTVADHLVVTDDPDDASLFAGDSVTFSVGVVGGKGTLTYRWQKDGKDIIGAPNSPDYTLTSLVPNDSGFYRCIVSDQGTDVRTSAEAELRVTHQVEAHPSAGAPAGGDVVTVTVWGLSLADEATTLVTFGGVAGGVTGVIEVVPGIQYDVACVTPPHAEGAVALGVANTATGDSVERSEGFTFADFYFVAHPYSTYKYVGNTHSFSGQITGGTAEYTYRWQEKLAPGVWNDQQVNTTSLTTTTYTLGPLTLADSKTFRCEASDGSLPLAATATTDEVFLSVHEHLAITHDPEGAHVYDGDTLILQVAAEGGLPKVHYEWRKNGVPVGASDAPSWVTPPLALGDSGSAYTCFVWDSGPGPDTALSAPATVTVWPHISISAPPVGGTFYVNETHTLSVAAAPGRGDLSYQWRHDGVDIPGANADTYDLSALTEDDAGVYVCVITDEGTDRVLSAPANVAVYQYVAITHDPQDAHVYVGDPLLLSVGAAGGVPPLHYEWRRNTAPAGGPDEATWEIEALDVEDAGIYTCYVTDSGSGPGVESALATVDVSPHVSIESNPEGETYYVGESHTFSVEASGGKGELSYQWRRNGEDIQEATESTYAVSSLTLDDGGVYTCTVKDEGTEELLSDPAVLVVVDHLEITEEPVSIEGYVGDSQSFTVTVRGGIGYAYTWERGRGEGWEDLGTTTSTLP
ncbi:MAG TPA: hypothetical protein ENN80_04570, partial [Candidatus Hydrogenedentes bacterium]|nr:hypothetical protein [Candidatus Hydrogenedentota bacterium]